MRNKLTPNYQKLTITHHLFKIFLVFFIFFFILFSSVAPAIASPIQERLQQFPQWNNKPPVKLAQGDLEYPDWMAGTWKVNSTLVEQVAPLAPDIVTPGFTDNESYLNRAIAFQVRFGKEYYSASKRRFSVLNSVRPIIVADRAFNGKNIAQAYLGDDNVYQVKIDPDNPNQQITFLKGERKLISKITGRAREILSDNQFIATEVTQQLFRSPERIYLNEVETTSNYRLLDSGSISAEQITAIYLSPQDPDYFTVGDRPVALYRYHLKLEKELSF